MPKLRFVDELSGAVSVYGIKFNFRCGPMYQYGDGSKIPHVRLTNTRVKNCVMRVAYPEGSSCANPYLCLVAEATSIRTGVPRLPFSSSLNMKMEERINDHNPFCSLADFLSEAPHSEQYIAEAWLRGERTNGKGFEVLTKYAHDVWIICGRVILNTADGRSTQFLRSVYNIANPEPDPENGKLRILDDFVRKPQAFWWNPTYKQNNPHGQLIGNETLEYLPSAGYSFVQ